MKEKVFLYKDNQEDRDSVKYFNLDSYSRGYVTLTGANFSTHFSYEKEYFDFDNDFECLTTILTKEEFFRLINHKDNEDNISDIINKLLSEENQELFNKVIEEEKEYVKNEYYLNDEDVEEIFSNYGLEYQDRGIIRQIYESYEEIGEQYFDDIESREVQHLRYYIDFERYGEDIADGNSCYILPSGYIVEYNY